MYDQQKEIPFRYRLIHVETIQICHISDICSGLSDAQAGWRKEVAFQALISLYSFIVSTSSLPDSNQRCLQTSSMALYTRPPASLHDPQTVPTEQYITLLCAAELLLTTG